MSDNQRQAIRRKLGLEKYPAILGDANGVIEDDPVRRPGMIRVRYATAAGLSLPPLVSIGNYQGQMKPGLGVWVGWQDGQLCLLRPNVSAQIAAGYNPSYGNGADDRLRRATTTDAIVMFKSHPTSPVSTYVVVRSWLYIESGTVKLFDASGDDGAGGFKGKINLASYIPTAGNHRLACLFLKPDNTIQVVASTTQSILEPLDLTDAQECFAAAVDTTKPCWAWRLADGQTTIGDESSWLDLRQFINVASGATVTGPATSTDTAIATWNGATGRTLRDNPLATINAAGDATLNSLLVRSSATTIAAGAIGVGSGWIVVSASVGTTDNLATLSSVPAGKWVVLRAAVGHTITVKHGTGNIFLNGAADFALSGDKSLLLFCDGTHWEDVGAGGTGAASPLTTKGDLYTRSTVDARLPVGANGQIVRANSTPAVGVEWADTHRAPVQGRLSLSSTLAVSTSDITAATTGYLLPYKGNQALVQVGGIWTYRSIPDIGVSFAIPATLFKLFDVYLYDNAGTLTAETLDWNQTTGVIAGATNASPIVITATAHGLANGAVVGIAGLVGNTAANTKIWTVANVTANTFELAGSTGNGAWTSGGTWYTIPSTRATALTTLNGFYAKTGDTTRLYLGTGMTTGTSGQCEDSDANRLLYNYYNRLQRRLKRIDSNSSWIYTYPGANFVMRMWDNTPANRVGFIQGVLEDKVYFDFVGLHSVSAGGTAGVGIGIDSVTTSSADLMAGSNSTASILTVARATYDSVPTIGYHYAQLLEMNGASNTTFYGNVGLPSGLQYGATGHIWG